jgi:transposase
LEKLCKPVRVVSVYDAGYDGFWLHRRLTAAGIENRVVDAASIPVERRSRRRKTDRIDLELLIRMLLALERGETRICRVVQVPTPTEEDAKREHRERAVLVKEKTAHTNRIGGIAISPSPAPPMFAQRHVAGGGHKSDETTPCAPRKKILLVLAQIGQSCAR